MFTDPTGLSAESDAFYKGLGDGSISAENSQDVWDDTVGKQKGSSSSGNTETAAERATRLAAEKEAEEVEAVQDLIADVALSYVGSTDWNYGVEKGIFSSETNKCNLFVSDITSDAGASPGLPRGNPLKVLFGKGSPPTASNWADPNYKIPGWKVLSSEEKPKPGDVVSQKINYSDATGHVAIVTGDKRSTGTSGYDPESIKETDWGFREKQEGQVTFRRWTGE